MSIILSHSEVLLGQNHSVWDSMMLILAAREILYIGPLKRSIYGAQFVRSVPVADPGVGGGG